ncbi:MAG: hypothetical protein B6242_02080 [Anaerolineaceae bacterium 4572_78]|nr:MAG: hypothetical protein B6242_02080 [Anaerolineaceae bacterium 4572_78]
MKFKLDENFGARTQNLFIESGHDVHTVCQESLQGTGDDNLYHVCCSEKRCLVTLDLDFSDIIRFPPKTSHGIVVIRVPQNPSLQLLKLLIKQFIKALDENTLIGNLWIVEVGRIRIRQEK